MLHPAISARQALKETAITHCFLTSNSTHAGLRAALIPTALAVLTCYSDDAHKR